MFAFDKPLTWIIILLIVLLIFGAGKLPDIGKSLGRSIKEFKEETQTGMKDEGTPVTPASPTSSAAPGSGATSGQPVIRRRVIKHPDGSEEIIEETVSQK